MALRMLSYRHSFHAGNFADVLKHLVLVQLLQALRRKDSPFCVLDSHAGAGLYDLQADTAQKTGEYSHGIARLWHSDAALWSDYLASVRACNPDGQLRYYPGSPCLIRHWLRAQDRLLLCELHPSDYALLRQQFSAVSQAAVHQRDGFEAFKALLPPKEKRGLVLIDPPYERDAEYAQVVQGLALLQQRWSHAVVAVWYPLVARRPVEQLRQAAVTLNLPKALRVELCIAPEDSPQGLYGCGLLLINTPWQLDQQLATQLPLLAQQLRQTSEPVIRLDWLTPA